MSSFPREKQEIHDGLHPSITCLGLSRCAAALLQTLSVLNRPLMLALSGDIRWLSTHQILKLCLGVKSSIRWPSEASESRIGLIIEDLEFRHTASDPRTRLRAN